MTTDAAPLDAVVNRPEAAASEGEPAGQEHNMLDAALAYAAQGIAVFPLRHPLPDGGCSCGDAKCGTGTGKHPRTYNGLKAATTDCDQIRRWWNTWPAANSGVPTGTLNGLIVVDVDRSEGEESSNRPTTAAANDPIAEGSRNGTLASVAGSMRRRGMTQEVIEAALLTTNQQLCDPPLPDDEMAKQTAFEIYQEGDNATDNDLRDVIVRHSKGSQQAPRLKAMLTLAQSIPALVPVETIMARPNRSGATPELACLKGARAVMTTEIDEGSFLSESLVKQMTGGDPVGARHLYGAPFEFLPLFKLFVAGNHKPVIRGGDEGIWCRIDLIPFVVTIPTKRRDPELGAKPRAELPGILNWALTGCGAWQEQRLKPPKAVVDAVAEYKEDMDTLGQWLADQCGVGAGLTLRSSVAYTAHRFWADDCGHKRWSHAVFGRKMKEKFACRREAAGIVFTGVGPKAQSPTAAIDPVPAKVPLP